MYHSSAMYHSLLISHLQLISHVQIISHVINSVFKKITTETDDLGVIMEPEAEEGGCEEEFAMQEAEGPEESCEDTPSGIWYQHFSTCYFIVVLYQFHCTYSSILHVL